MSDKIVSEKLAKAIEELRKAREEEAAARRAQVDAEKVLVVARADVSRTQASAQNARTQVDDLIRAETAPAEVR